MGNGESCEFPQRTVDRSDSDKESVSYIKVDEDMNQLFNSENEDEQDYSSKQFDINKNPFSAVWSVYRCNGNVPKPRIGHFTAYFKKLHTCFIGYGRIEKNEYGNDVWAFNVDSCKWYNLKLHGDFVSPRNGSIATIMDHYIVVFGGEKYNNECCNELHTIDITTGEVIFAQTHGSKPQPRKGGCIAIYQKQLFIWGGEDNNKINNNLYVMNFNTMKWKSYSCNVEYYPGSSYIVKGSHIYVYGASETNDFTVIDMKNYTVSVEQTYPPYPPTGILFGGMVSIKNIIFYFGGYSETYWSFLYGFNIETKRWFLINIIPDGETTSISDGRINQDGYFLLPVLYSFSAVYIDFKKEIHGYLGFPLQSRRFFSLNIINVLSYIYMKEDMLQILYQ